MTDLELPGPFWLVGCGNMAGAMLTGWLNAGLDPRHVTVIDPVGKIPAEGVRGLTALPEDEVPALVMLGVKPQLLDEVAATLAPVLEPETMLISILAGVELASLRAHFPKPRALFRAMPNLPARLNRGVTGLHGQGDTQARKMVETLMKALGLVEWFDDEAQFQIVTALGGSGPAFLYRFIDMMGAAGEAQGLAPEQASRIALAMVAGAAELAFRSDVDPATLADRVTSPGGTTAAGLGVLDAALPELLRATLDAAVRRGEEMAEAARR
ncbi:pyrroline-5-carboxylate reductase [Sphingosinicella rhizophila]|uniref:Pyrroline-5-carboxylate reductase n=1 Tax=Sphingosinicella rhizophila TaxID=3050082 RepID=A0ABU3Q4D0_9SPHN|nr:pyrroline-5-carboxylate reductase [Sphingosinicella sp. GR2756]MDT9598256.1 pyrroline-5-carboxylate reductase [Sphingosinicella sp. GR2756]